MKVEIKGDLRVLVAENGYLTQNTDAKIDNRIFVKQKMLLTTENESDYKEVAKVCEYAVPEKISNLQLRSQLIIQGFDLGMIEQTFNQIADATQRGLIVTAWEYATNFYRNNPMIVAMGKLLVLTSAQVDEIFIKASKL